MFYFWFTFHENKLTLEFFQLTFSTMFHYNHIQFSSKLQLRGKTQVHLFCELIKLTCPWELWL